MPAIKEDKPLFGSYTHEAHYPRAAEALQMLHRIAALVKPIMRDRGWRVGQLCEFNPEWEALLGTNLGHGIRISIRLRNPPNKSQFLEFDFIMDTMLHEFGPHDDKFNALWDELRVEYKALRSNGWNGEGFSSPGYKVGGFVYSNPQELQRLARAAAETKKAQVSSGPRRIGGTAPPRGVDIRKTIADAAQRRIDMSKACEAFESNPQAKAKVLADAKRHGVETAGKADDPYTQAVQQAFMDMVKKEGVVKSQSKKSVKGSAVSRSRTKHVKPASSSRNAEKPKIPGVYEQIPTGPPPGFTDKGLPPMPTEHDSPFDPFTSGLTKARSPSVPTEHNRSYGHSESDSSNGKWACPICTYHNPAEFLCCGVCLVEKPLEPAVSNPQPSQLSQASRPTLPSQFGNLSVDEKAARSKSATEQIAKLTEAEKQLARTRPRNWTCHKCRTVVDHQWWLCTKCQTMRLTS